MKLYESIRRNLKESVKDEAYEIADMVEKSFGDRDFVTRDDFDEAFTRALQEVYKLKDLESVWDNYELPDGTDVNNLEADVRGILGYNGWETIFEGPEEGGLTTVGEEDRLNLAEYMCGFIGDLFKHESDDFKSNDESLYDWCEGGDTFRNAGIPEDDCKVLDKMLLAINPKVQEINAIIRKESGIDLFESEKKKH